MRSSLVAEINPSKDVSSSLQADEDLDEGRRGTHRQAGDVLPGGDSYGNIVRGWEQSRVFSSRSRRVADKERLFSHSSYTVWLESRSRPPSSEEAKEESAGFVKNKRVRRLVQRRESSSLRKVFPAKGIAPSGSGAEALM